MLGIALACLPLAAGTVEAAPKGKAKAAGANANANTKVPDDNVKTNVAPSKAKPTKPAPPSGGSADTPLEVPIGAVTKKTVTSTSLVSDGSDAALRWITPLLTHWIIRGENGAVSARLSSRAIVINPDTGSSAFVRVTCYPQRGRPAFTIEATLRPLDAKALLLAPAGDALQEFWCRIDADRAVLAYASVSTPGEVGDGAIQEPYVPLFKAIPAR